MDAGDLVSLFAVAWGSLSNNGSASPAGSFGTIMERRLVHRILYVAGILLLTVCIGTIGFSLIEHWGAFDAFYMTVTTMTTVGYQEIRPLSRTGRIFNSFVIFFGVSAMFFAVGAVTQTMIELDTRIAAGDFLIVLGDKPSLNALEKSLNR